MFINRSITQLTEVKTFFKAIFKPSVINYWGENDE